MTEKVKKRVRIFVSISTILIIGTTLSVLPFFLFKGTSSEASESNSWQSNPFLSHDPLGPDPGDGGGAGILGLGDFITNNGQYLCTAGKPYDYSPYDTQFLYVVIMGNMFGKLTSGLTYTASADAYWDGPDCGWGVDLGELDNDRDLEFYVDPAIAMDASGARRGYFQFRIPYILECTGGCDSQCHAIGGSPPFEDYAMCGTSDGDMTFRKSVPVSPGYCDDDFWNDSLCIPRYRYNPDNGVTGVRYYQYQLETIACTTSACTTTYEQRDEGCVKVTWVQ